MLSSGRDRVDARRYNIPSGALVRGIFTLDLAPERSNATLIFEGEAFSDDDGKPWIGTLDYFP